jgi:hypothetical protein
MSRAAVRCLIVAILFCSASSLFAASLSPRQDLPSIDEVRETYALYDIEGVTTSDGSMRVSIYNKSAELIFESRFPVKKADGKYFEWKYYPQPGYSMSRHLDPQATRTLRGMIYSAKDVVRAFHRGFVSPDGKTFGTPRSGKFAIKALDNWGCDAPFESLTCTASGNCCDQHDDCYAIFNCDALSWLGLGSQFCTGCNEMVTLCITAGYNNSGYPSVCCYNGNCGQERPPGTIGGGGGGECCPIFDQDGYVGGGGTGGYPVWTPWGTIWVGYNGTCTFSNGITIPCG